MEGVYGLETPCTSWKGPAILVDDWRTQPDGQVMVSTFPEREKVTFRAAKAAYARGLAFWRDVGIFAAVPRRGGYRFG
jgi:hypothetical protein